MSERRFRLELRDGCLSYQAAGVMLKGEDTLWRYWIEFEGHCIPGVGEFPPTRAGHARLKACAHHQLVGLIWPRHHGTPEDVR